MMLSKLLYILIFSPIFSLSGCSDNGSDIEVIDSSNTMKEFAQNLQANRILTKRILDTTADEKLEDKIIANISSKQDPYLSNDKDILQTLSKERQAIYYIYLFEMEINNGGFDQFYLNKFVNSDDSRMFDKTTGAFKLIGATKFADLVKRANQIYRANEKDFADKEGLFDELDQEFYGTYKQENLFDLRTKFIRANIDAFVDK